MVVTLLTWWLRTPTASIFSKQGRSFINNLLYLSLRSHIVLLLQCTIGPNSHKPTLIQVEGDQEPLPFNAKDVKELEAML